MKRSRPFVRKESLWSRLQTYPFDFFLYVNETVSSTPWDDYAETVGIPAGYSLSALYIIMMKIGGYYRSSNRRRANPLFQTNQFDYERIKSRAADTRSSSLTLSYYSGILQHLLSGLTVVLFVFSIVNAAYLLTSHKNYTLLFSNIDSKPKTSSAHKITLTNDDTGSTWNKIVKMLYSRASRKHPRSTPATSTASNGEEDDDSEVQYSDSDFDETTMDEINLIEKEIWELSVWTPSKFRLSVGATFSPLLLTIVYLLVDDLPTWKLLFIGACVSGSLHFLMLKFLCLIQDKQILYQEMFEEYNSKFVKPKMSVLKKDVNIDATFGPDAPSVLTVKTDQKGHLVTAKLKVFITHDIEGKAYNNLSIAQRRKITPRGDVTTTTTIEGAADTTAQPLANSSYILPDSFNTSRHPYQQLQQQHQQHQQLQYPQQQYQPSVTAAKRQVYSRPLESPFKSPDKRDTYYGQQLSTPYSRQYQVAPHTTGGQRRTQNEYLSYDRSYPNIRSSISSSPSRSRLDSRGRDFQSPKPRPPPARSLLKTPVPLRRSHITSRSPSPTKRF